MRQAVAISVPLLARTSCVSTMPFGSPVVPLVYMMLYGSLPVSPASGGSVSRTSATSDAYERKPGRSPSTSTHRSSRMAASFSRTRWSAGARAWAEITIDASAFSSREVRPLSWRSGLSGTTTMPVFVAAR